VPKEPADNRTLAIALLPEVLARPEIEREVRANVAPRFEDEVARFELLQSVDELSHLIEIITQRLHVVERDDRLDDFDRRRGQICAQAFIFVDLPNPRGEDDTPNRFVRSKSLKTCDGGAKHILVPHLAADQDVHGLTHGITLVC
jgi:hypothetical protein